MSIQTKLQSHLENIRSKPEHVQKRYSFSVAFIITAVIFAFWLGSFNPVSQSSSNAVVAKTVNNIGTPNQSLTASVGSLFTDIRDLVLKPKKVSYSGATIEVGPGKN